MNETLQQIRAELRQSMNGITSKSMRERGLDYKLNFGVDIPRLRQIATHYKPDAALSSFMWSQQTRELKILATLLYPVDKFDIEIAEKWVKEIPNHEVREQVCMNLFQKLSFADKLVHGWANSSDEEVRITGYWLLARLIIEKTNPVAVTNTREVVEKMVVDLNSDTYFLRLAAQNALRFMVRSSGDCAREILSKIGDFEMASDSAKKEIYDSLKFEFDAANC